MSLYDQLLLFPERAEYIHQDQYSFYRVRLDHWRELSATFLDAFKAVHERQSAAVLLVHGTQGTGKTLFCLELEKGFDKSRNENNSPDENNLWHALVADRPMQSAVIKQATEHTALRRVLPESGWLAKERSFARENRQQLRLFVIDDVHKDVFLREWAGLEQGDYLRLKADGKEAVALETVAQQLVQDCRGDFQRSIFLLLSNNADLVSRLAKHVDESHVGLAKRLELPLPEPSLKEAIVRTNINTLNRVSYWYCLDKAGPNEKKDVHSVLKGNGGFTDSFQAIGRALGSDKGKKRSGRPANKNLMTLVTLGTEPFTAKAFIEDQELNSVEQTFIGKHIGYWFFRDRWASSLDPGRDPNLSRRARMLESEFSLLWITLDMKACYALLGESPKTDSLGKDLMEVIRFFPSIAKPSRIQRQKQVSQQVDTKLDTEDWGREVEALSTRFHDLGQRRNQYYEEALAKRFEQYGRGFVEFSTLRPDIIEGEYTPCAVTRSNANKTESIKDAIRRTCHAIEFTAHLQVDMRGLVEYILQKVDSYSQMLESV